MSCSFFFASALCWSDTFFSKYLLRELFAALNAPWRLFKVTSKRFQIKRAFSISFRAAAWMGAAFERVVQQLSLELDSVEAGVSDVRVMAGAGGEARSRRAPRRAPRRQSPGRGAGALAPTDEPRRGGEPADSVGPEDAPCTRAGSCGRARSGRGSLLSHELREGGHAHAFTLREMVGGPMRCQADKK